MESNVLIFVWIRICTPIEERKIKGRDFTHSVEARVTLGKGIY